jgi:uncharacterized membrane protein YfcA
MFVLKSGRAASGAHMIVTILLGALAVIAAGFSVVLLHTAAKRGELGLNLESIGLGAVTNFFDTLGIGSFAPTTAYLKFRKLIPDSFLPPTLNVGHALPTVAQALIFITLVEVDPTLLIACIIAAVAGATLGAPIVVRLPVRLIQSVMGIALLIAAGLYAGKNLGWLPGGGAARLLDEPYFALAIGGHFILGALMSLGIGLYAPSLMMLSLMGLDPKAAFPIMMGSCAFLMPISGVRFIHSDRINLKIVLGIALGGIPAVLVAALIVKELDVQTLRWGVVVVVLYASALLLYSALRPPPPLAAGSR